MRAVLIAVLLVVVGFVILAVGYAAEQASLRAEAQKARTISQAFATTLKGQLVAAIKADGHTSAIAVCQQIAPQISAQYSADGLHIGRTALKLRNPANAPDEWERGVLESFQAALDKGTDIKTLERYAFFGDEAGGKTFRYMKAIPVGQPCLACHGANIASDVRAVLAARYPGDKAVDFALGDLRGAFSVQKAMQANP